MLIYCFVGGGPYRPYTQIPLRKRDDDDNHLRTSSVSSSLTPPTHRLIEQEQPFSNNPSLNVKVCVIFLFKKKLNSCFYSKSKQIDLSPYLSQMTVKDIGDCLKNDIIGLKPTMISIYIQDMNENNINGRVLSTCDLEELKQVKKIFVFYNLIFFY